MNIWELVMLGFGLSMDAAAVSICKGLAAGRASFGQCLTAGVYFGGFQALMPLLGYVLGRTFAVYIHQYDHWVAFILLAMIGINMLRESFEKEAGAQNASFCLSAMLPLAVATSIDALAVGVSFSFYLNWRWLLAAIALIGGITLILSALAVRLGSIFGSRHRRVAQRVGGCILILIGGKILLEGLGVLSL